MIKLNARVDLKTARYNSDAVKKSIGKMGSLAKGIFGNSTRDCYQNHTIFHMRCKISLDVKSQILLIYRMSKAEFEHRLRKREPEKDLEGYMNSQNKVCSLRLEVSKGKLDDEFTLEEVERAISELKGGKCSKSYWICQGSVH